MKYFESFLIGVKETLNFKLTLALHVVSPLIMVSLLSFIWGNIYDKDFLTYFVGVSLLLPSFTFYSSSSTKFMLAIRNGWEVSFAKPINLFLFISSYNLGRHFIPYLINLTIAFSYLLLNGVEINLAVLGFSLPFIVLFDTSMAYFISLFAHYFYSIWGVRVIIKLIDVLLSGLAFPFNLINLKETGIYYLPFAHKVYYIFEASIKGVLPVDSYLILLAYSLFLVLIALPFHKLGWKKFEAQGG